MSNDEDCCFWCQEQGHIAWNCPHIRCFECDEYGHIVMDCPHRIPSLGTSKTSPTQTSQKLPCPGQVQGTTMKTGTGKVIPDHNLIFIDIAARVITIHTEATPGYDIGIIAATPGVAHETHAPHIEITAINPTTPEIIHHVHIHPTNLQGEICTGHIHIPADHEANHISRRTWGVTIEDPHTDYYSSDEHSSDSGEEADHLNWVSPLQVVNPMNKEGYLCTSPTITIHAGKCYKALTNSGTAISLIRYSTYQSIDDSFKTPIQPTTTKVNTADGSPMISLRITALLRIADFKFTHNFIIYHRLPDTEIIFGIDVQKKFLLSYAFG